MFGHPFEDSEISPGTSGPARSLETLGRILSLEVASFALTEKFSEALEALRACIFARAGRFCARTCFSKRPRNAPILDFEPDTAVFWRFFHAVSAPCAKRPTSTKPCKNQCETHFGASAHRSKFEAKSICQRFRFRLVTRTPSRASWKLSLGSWSVSGAARACGQLLAALHPPERP